MGRLSPAQKSHNVTVCCAQGFLMSGEPRTPLTAHPARWESHCPNQTSTQWLVCPITPSTRCNSHKISEPRFESYRLIKTGDICKGEIQREDRDLNTALSTGLAWDR